MLGIFTVIYLIVRKFNNAFDYIFCFAENKCFDSKVEILAIRINQKCLSSGGIYG